MGFHIEDVQVYVFNPLCSPAETISVPEINPENSDKTVLRGMLPEEKHARLCKKSTPVFASHHSILVKTKGRAWFCNVLNALQEAIHEKWHTI